MMESIRGTPCLPLCPVPLSLPTLGKQQEAGSGSSCPCSGHINKSIFK